MKIHNQRTRIEVSAYVLHGLGILKKWDDSLGGYSYTGPDLFPAFADDEFNRNRKSFDLKPVSIMITKVEVQDEQILPVIPPKFKDVPKPKSKAKEPSALDIEAERLRSIQNKDKVCTCGEKKKLAKSVVVERSGFKNSIRTTAVYGAKKRKRCKKCEGCLAPSCNKCICCLNPKMKQSCRQRICLYPIIPRCPCFD